MELLVGPESGEAQPVAESVAMTIDDWDLEPMTIEVDDWDRELEDVSENVEDDHLDEIPDEYEATMARLEAERAADVAERSSSAAESFAQLVMDLLSTPAPIEPAGSSHEIDWDAEFAATKTRENPATDDIADFIVNMPCRLVLTLACSHASATGHRRSF